MNHNKNSNNQNNSKSSSQSGQPDAIKKKKNVNKDEVSKESRSLYQTEQ